MTQPETEVKEKTVDNEEDKAAEEFEKIDDDEMLDLAVKEYVKKQISEKKVERHEPEVNWPREIIRFVRELTVRFTIFCMAFVVVHGIVQLLGWKKPEEEPRPNEPGFRGYQGGPENEDPYSGGHDSSEF